MEKFNIKNLRKTQEVLEKLDTLCKTYFEKTEPEWKYYGSWAFSQTEKDTIILSYWFYIESDGNKYTDSDSVMVKFEDLLKYQS